MKRERERADPLRGREVDGVAAAARDPHRRVRLLARLRHDVARRHGDELTRVPGERLLGHAPQRDARALFPHRALLLGIEHEPAQLGFRRRLPGSEVDPTVRHEVEHRDALGDACRVVESRRGLHDAVCDADPLRAARRPRQGRPRARWSGCTPRGSGARLPTRSRCPNRSASSHCSSAFWISSYSESSAHGRGSGCS